MPYIVLCVLLILPNFAAAFVLSDDSRKVPLGTQMWVFEDVRGDTTIEDVTSAALRGSFRQHDEEALNAGYTASVFWIRVDLNYVSLQNATAQPWWLVLAYPPLDDVRLYQADAQGRYRLIEHTGDTLPYSSRQIKRGNYVFELQLEPGKPQSVYLRVTSQGVLMVPLSLWSPKAYLEELPKRTYAMGALLGVVLVMLVYNLFIFISVRDTSYLYYILYIASFGLYLTTFNGIAVELLWPESPWWANVCVPFLIGSTSLFGAQFVRTFLHMSEHSVWTDRVLRVLMLCAVLVMVLSLTAEYWLSLRLATYLTLILTVIAFCSGLLAWFSGMRVARYFIIAWTAFLFGGLITALMGLGFLPSTFLTMNAGQIGCALEVSLLSLALADRINTMKEERAAILQDNSLKLEALNKELAVNNVLKDQFLSTVTHELRTPMIGVIGSLELMQTVPMNDELTQYHKTAYGSARDMLGMVNDILHLTELQAERLYPRRAHFSLRGLAESLRSKYQARAEELGLEFSVRLDENLPDVLEGDVAMLGQCIDRLLDNALKFTPSGWVSVSFNLGAGDQDALPLRIEVRDSGVGFSTAASEKLYQRFQQLDGSPTREFGGLGIGLSICRQLVKLLGGTLSHSSTPGKGSCFQIELPSMILMHQSTAQDVRKRTGPVLRQEHQCTILLIKGNAANKLLIRGMLKKMGYQVRCADSSAEAMSILRECPIDAVLLDAEMPEMDGFAICRALRLLPGCETLPVFALASDNRNGERERYVEAGMTDYLPEPVRFEQLRKMLNDWVLCKQVHSLS
jgi:signal transduction histidine kinase/ActR/RegA family two-component response regulator